MSIDPVWYKDPTWLGGIGTLLLGFGGKALQLYRKAARENRPLFQNGERAAVQQALTLMMEAQTGTQTRVTALEVRLRQEVADGRREHDDLRGRIEYLEERDARRKAMP